MGKAYERDLGRYRALARSDPLLAFVASLRRGGTERPRWGGAWLAEFRGPASFVVPGGSGTADGHFLEGFVRDCGINCNSQGGVSPKSHYRAEKGLVGSIF
jgi:hypothetical protein